MIQHILLILVVGKILENLTLGPPRIEPSNSPPSQPPTPPRTPLSPKTESPTLKKDQPQFQPKQPVGLQVSATSSLNSFTTREQVIPNITITQTSPASLLQQQQKLPLNLGVKTNNNGFGSNSGGCSSSSSNKSFTNGGNVLPDYPYSQIEMDAIRNKTLEDRHDQQKNFLNSRVSNWNCNPIYRPHN